MNELKWQWQLLVPYLSRLALALLLGYLAIAANIGLMGTSGYLIAAAALHPATILLLWTPIVGVRFFGISRSVFRYFERLVSHDLTFRILASVRVWYYRHLEASASDPLERYRSADLLAAAVTDVESLQNLYLRVFAPPIIAVLVGVMSFLLIARYSGWAALLFAVCFVVSGAVLPVVTLWVSRSSGEQEVHARAQLHTSLGDSLAGMTELLVDGRSETALTAMASSQEQLSRALRQRRLVESITSGFFVLITNAAVFLAFVVLIPLVTSGHIAGVQIPSLLFIVLASFEAVMPLPAAAQSLVETLSATRRIRNGVLDARGTDDTSHEGLVFPVGARSLSAEAMEDSSETGVGLGAVGSEIASPLTNEMVPVLALKSLGVNYQPGTEPALQEVDLTLWPGQVVAVVGESGSGKSTLLNALLRLCPYSGTILIDGKDAASLSDEEVRGLFSVVTQPTYLFHVSVADNLRLARPGADDAQLWQAAEVAQIGDVLEKLPEGLNTVVGEGGTRFSGGERQRIGLARAVLRGAPILLLDEPTSGLDVQTEAEFQKTLWQAKGNRSVLYVTHQLAGLDLVDWIVVMKNGCIVEEGTFETLLNQSSSVFRQLWEKAQGQLAQP